MDRLTIRSWRRGDLEEIADLWLGLARHINPMDGFYRLSPDARRSYGGYLERVFGDRNYVVFVADEGRGLVGFAMGRLNRSPSMVLPETVGYIENVFIQEGRRRSGIGTALCRMLLDWFRERGINHVELFYQVANSGAASFWEKMGFKTWLAKAYRIV